MMLTDINSEALIIVFMKTKTYTDTGTVLLMP